MGLSFVFDGLLALASLAAVDPTPAISPPLVTAPAPTGEAEAVTPPEILVTGERVNRRLRDTASSVIVFRADSIESIPAADRLESLLALVPNLQLGSGSDAPTIRGQDSTGVLNNLPAFLGGARPRATLQIDGRPASFNEFLFGIASLWDVAQVEVFRSPQTTTQGRNAIAGGIFITTVDPESRWHARGRLVAGTGDRAQASAMLTGPILGDQLAFRLSGDIERDEPASRIAPLMRGANPNHDRQSLLRLKLLARPDALPGARLTLSLTHSEGQSPQIVGLSPPFRARRDVAPGYGIFRTRVDSATAVAALPVTTTLTSTTTVAGSRSRFRRFAIPGLGEARSRFRDLSLESLLAWHPSPELRLSGGVNRLASSLNQDIDISLFGRTGSFADRQHSLGVFGEAEWHPARRLTLTAGARRQHDDQRRTGILTRPGGPAAIDFRGHFSAWLPKLTVAYDATDSFTAGLLVQKAYNPGGATLTLRGVTDTFDAETLWDYEVFARGTSAHGRLHYSANLFVNRIRDAQRLQVELITLPGGIKIENVEFSNAPRARSKGLELSLDWRATDRLRLQAGLGLLDTKVTRTVTAIDPILGREFARSPHASGSAAIDWRPIEPLRLSAQVRAHGPYFSDDGNSRALRIGGATLVDVRASYDLGRVNVALYARNLFNRFALTNLLDPSLATAEDPRRVGIELETHF